MNKEWINGTKEIPKEHRSVEKSHDDEHLQETCA
jgi:hypothetical protein